MLSDLAGVQETYPNVVTCMLNVFSIDLYSLPNPSATLFLFTPSISTKFENIPDIQDEPFMASTPVGE